MQKPRNGIFPVGVALLFIGAVALVIGLFFYVKSRNLAEMDAERERLRIEHAQRERAQEEGRRAAAAGEEQLNEEKRKRHAEKEAEIEKRVQEETEKLDKLRAGDTKCFMCNGRGLIRDGDPKDGLLKSIRVCPNCKGAGKEK